MLDLIKIYNWESSEFVHRIIFMTSRELIIEIIYLHQLLEVSFLNFL